MGARAPWNLIAQVTRLICLGIKGAWSWIAKGTFSHLRSAVWLQQRVHAKEGGAASTVGP